MNESIPYRELAAAEIHSNYEIIFFELITWRIRKWFIATKPKRRILFKKSYGDSQQLSSEVATGNVL